MRLALPPGWRPRPGTKVLVLLTLVAVLVPLQLLLPALHDRAALDWHVATTIGPAEVEHVGVVVGLLTLYTACLMLRYLALLVGSIVGSILDGQMTPPDDAVPAAGLAAGASLPPVSILVPAYNEALVIRQSIRSLLALDYPDLEILVIDDGSTDDTWLRAHEAAEGSSRVRVLRKRNGGKSDALNFGLAQARSPLVLSVDADSRLDPAALRRCVRHFDDPTIGAVAGNIKVANRENAVTRLQALEYIQGLALERRAQSAIRAVSVIGGPLGLFRRDALRSVGGYDHDTFAEDRDLTLKLLGQGWTVSYEPAAVAEAESPSRWIDLLSQRYRWTRGTVQCVFKHRLALLDLRRRPVLSLSLWYMAIDSILVPAFSLAVVLAFTWATLAWGAFEFLLMWWMLAMSFDVAVSAYCLVIDDEDLGLLPNALLLRFYAIFSDLAKLIATGEECLRLEMNWGKLMREGKI